MAYFRRLLSGLGIVLATGVSLAALSSATRAADLIPLPVPHIGFSWTGFYAGINLGAASNGSQWRFFNTDGSAVTGGFQAGFNYQIQQIVFGVEGQIDGVGLDAKRQCTEVGSDCFTKQDWLGSVRGRLGFSPFDRLLIYGTGGAAFTNYKFGEDAHLIQSWSDSSRTGWTAGLGAQFALTNSLILGAEWQHFDFGQKTSGGGINPTTISPTEGEDTFTVRVDYKVD